MFIFWPKANKVNPTVALSPAATNRITPSFFFRCSFNWNLRVYMKPLGLPHRLCFSVFKRSSPFQLSDYFLLAKDWHSNIYWNKNCKNCVYRPDVERWTHSHPSQRTLLNWKTELLRSCLIDSHYTLIYVARTISCTHWERPSLCKISFLVASVRLTIKNK